ncbi:hypothetical protein [Leucobacter denitrificans]|uniref:Lipoprotein n=1 Tax=Leucobacter denitrificans TaxID=683042 RepID=A0A7G9S2R8_9MICO|nr:hypothetical protein [Leucobacter denitrificans]QNN62143.1 hypothetical protein H9L06_07530 [Leucobacter denitrificans]
MRHISTLLIAGIASFVLIGCSSTDTNSIPIPDGISFSGPHAETFEEVWKRTTSDFSREVIKDQRITDQEWAETKSRMEQCISDTGMTLDSIDEDGGTLVSFNSVPPSLGGEKVDECSMSSGLDDIGFLRYQLITNPNNIEPSIIMAECLVRAKVVEPSYSAAQYLEEIDLVSESHPGISYVVDPEIGYDALITCSDDPTNSFQ